MLAASLFFHAPHVYAVSKCFCTFHDRTGLFEAERIHFCISSSISDPLDPDTSLVLFATLPYCIPSHKMKKLKNPLTQNEKYIFRMLSKNVFARDRKRRRRLPFYNAVNRVSALF